MKAGRSLQDLAKAIETQNAVKRDFIAPARALEMALVEDVPMIAIKGDAYPIRPLAHQQLGEHLGIPKPYYDRLLVDDPLLLTQNVNAWLRKSPDRRLVRTFGRDYGIRAYLSDRFRPLDNLDLAEAILPKILEHQWDIKSCELTETRLYIKVVSEDIRAEVVPDHVNVRTGGRTHIVHPGLTITNSEVGLGSLRIEPTVHWEHCLNLATLNASVRRAHLGKRVGGEEETIEQFISDRTRELENAAIFGRVNDVVTATLTEEVFRKMIAQVAASTQDRILETVNPADVVEVVGRQYGLTDATRTSILRHLIDDGDLTRYGLANAVTRASQDVEDYDDATALERVGGQIIELPRNAWAELMTVPAGK